MTNWNICARSCAPTAPAWSPIRAAWIRSFSPSSRTRSWATNPWPPLPIRPACPGANWRRPSPWPAGFPFPLHVIRTREFDNPAYLANPDNRCYFCKHELFTELAPLAKAEGFAVIAYGENASDIGDYRPGAQAAARIPGPRPPQGGRPDQSRYPRALRRTRPAHRRQTPDGLPRARAFPTAKPCHPGEAQDDRAGRKRPARPRLLRRARPPPRIATAAINFNSPLHALHRPGSKSAPPRCANSSGRTATLRPKWPGRSGRSATPMSPSTSRATAAAA